MPRPRATAAAELDKLAALCGTLRLNTNAGDIATNLLEPIAATLGADAAACRRLRLHQSRPLIENLTSIGVAQSVADDYLGHFHRLDPFLDRLRLDLPTPPAGDASSRSFYDYYHDFLYPNALVRHTGFLVADANRQHAWVFNFHRPASAPDFSDLELARSRLVQACLQGQAEAPATANRNEFSPFPALPALTDREQDVVMAVGRGLSNKQIADSLAISPRTVENHLRNIYEKLHVNTRTQLLSRLTGNS